ncbi:malto-oligosyltrehalose trehalohydrolase [Dyadobacter sp. Leaf189]|uniref:malto-oligosyltrehalose trehalohydrolase n=1 Tax=Dyadobacter sp. Leaf189 TaxID=1736295 RepID=UPI0006F77782|nr:malto-oligosyltrehalose trehalohydrolase [Dyadobacter sp. Leaf189]KQS26798.1 malto-oligosyltrehalose trehalohydrolase [Dyadobacter sp. Leaf189]
MKRAGAWYTETGVQFRVWAPERKRMRLQLFGSNEEFHDMQPVGEGYYELHLNRVPNGTKYKFLPEGETAFPDPASQFQPEGVHGPSAIVDHQYFQWSDLSWKGRAFDELIIYELHIGTFTAEGTFKAAAEKLPELAASGINAIELMPVSEFPGNRNWGYDGTYPYAVHSGYGGPDGLKYFVNAAHENGIAVILDVVFNHLGPEGNYLHEFGPYFTECYVTPWGKAINMDGEWSDGVRNYFSDLVPFWYEEYHLDGLRLDAIHTIYDKGAVHFWELVEQKLKQARQRNGRTFHMIAESDLNSPKVVKSAEYGGYGFDAQWLDDFHHAFYVMLDPAGADRYADFGKVEQVAKAFTDGFVHSGEYVKFRKRRHGASSVGLPGDSFVVFNLNHDQVGNRVGGERLSVLVDFERQKLAAAAIMLSPYVPMLFMGEEYGEDTPFFYFVSHTEEDLIEKVVEGRASEFAEFGWDEQPPNPQEEDTFQRSKIQWEKRNTGKYRVLRDWHSTLIKLRQTHPALRNFNKNDVRVHLLGPQAFVLIRLSADQQVQLACIFNLSDNTVTWTFPEDKPQWTVLLDSAEMQWAEDADAALMRDRHEPTHVSYKASVVGAGVKVLEAADPVQA